VSQAQQIENIDIFHDMSGFDLHWSKVQREDQFGDRAGSTRKQWRGDPVHGGYVSSVKYEILLQKVTKSQTLVSDGTHHHAPVSSPLSLHLNSSAPLSLCSHSLILSFSHSPILSFSHYF
jgi:hypothetical protein